LPAVHPARTHGFFRPEQKQKRQIPAENARAGKSLATPSRPPMVNDSDPDEDTALMFQLKAGDDAALNVLMQRWQEPLVRFILRYTGNPTDAVELAQEVFVRVYQHRSHFTPNRHFSTWVYTIATNLCRNHARWHRNHPATPLEDEEGGSGSTGVTREPSPAAHAENSEVAALVRDQIQRLPRDLKTVILLFEYEECSYEQIAGVLGCTPKAVETRLYRARKLLRKALSDAGILGTRG
jgi:RNA polymerase sigma-70 factor (ECF subfamily)